MQKSEVDSKLLAPEEAKKEQKERSAHRLMPWLIVLYLVGCVYFLNHSLHAIATKNKIENIWKFLIDEITDGKLRVQGAMWRVIVIYLFYIFCGVLGLLNYIPSVRRYLDRESYIPWCYSRRSSLLGFLIIAMNIFWIWNLIKTDLHSYSIKKDTVKLFYKISSFWLNLLWALAILFCTRNTLFQQIYNAPYATIISLHRLIGTTAFWVTIAHILLAFGKWHMKHPNDFFKYMWHHIWYYTDAKIEIFNLNWRTSTSLLLRLLPAIIILMISVLPLVRRKAWEFFLACHQIIIIIIVYLFIFHSGYFYYDAIIPIILYICDKLIRWFTIYTNPSKVVKCEAFGDLVYVDVETHSLFCKNMVWPDLVGSVAYLRIPKAEFFQYHPISIAYNIGNHLIFYIKVVGNEHSWSHQVAKLSGQSGFRAFIEGPYTMVKRESDKKIINEEQIQSATKLVADSYDDNVLVVAGGSGFAGVSAYLNDYLKLVSKLPESVQQTKNLTVVLVAPHHEHLDCMHALIAKCLQYDFCHVHLYATYSKNADLKESAPKGKDAASFTPKNMDNSSVEENTQIHFTVGRPQLSAIVAEMNEQPITAFFCGPKPLHNMLFRVLKRQPREFSFHSEIFDM